MIKGNKSSFAIGILFSVICLCPYYVYYLSKGNKNALIALMAVIVLAIPTILFLTRICSNRTGFYRGALIACVPVIAYTVISVSLQEVGIDLFRTYSDILVMMIGHFFGVACLTAIIYFAYCANSLERLPIKEMLISLTYCLVIALVPRGLCYIYKTSQQNIIGLITGFFTLLLPVLLYVIFAKLSKNRVLFSSSVISFYLLYAVPIIYIPNLNFTWDYYYGLLIIITYGYVLPFLVIFISVADHIIALKKIQRCHSQITE